MSRIWLWVLLAILALFLLSSNAGGRRTWAPVEQWIIEALGPVQELTTSTVEKVREFWLQYFYLVDLREENKRLRSRINALRMENSRYRELSSAYERLQQLLYFRREIERPAVACRVIGLDPTGWFRSIILDKGKSDGLDLDMPVVNSSGVVGRVVSVSANHAKVLLLIDQNSAVDGINQRSRDRGIVRGMNAEICRMDYVGKSSDFLVEDIVVTTGLGGIFPKGLPIGHVRDISGSPGELFKKIDVMPAVDFSKLEEVLVVLKQR